MAEEIVGARNTAEVSMEVHLSLVGVTLARSSLPMKRRFQQKLRQVQDLAILIARYSKSLLFFFF